MIVKVHEHTIEIDKTPVNELEVNVTKMQFQFDETIPSNYVKKAYFTLGNTSIEVLLNNNECDIPSEVLTKMGTVRLGVIAYEVQDDTLIERFNPSPDYFETWEGSMVEADNTEPITPTDKEQIEAQLQEVTTQMDNLDVEAEKVEHTTTITITHKDGTTSQVQVLDGEKGDKGDKGDAGAIKMLIVAELPSTGADDTIYLVPITPDTSGNNYAEYVYINGAWEVLGRIGVQVDLTDYVRFTDYATSSVGGVIKVNTGYGIAMDSGFLAGSTKTYANYTNGGNSLIICKGTLENVITGKGLVSNTNYASTTNAGVIKLNNGYAIGVVASSGDLFAQTWNYSSYPSMSGNAFISKGTLENVLTAKIGDIQTLLDNLDSGGGVE